MSTILNNTTIGIVNKERDLNTYTSNNRVSRSRSLDNKVHMNRMSRFRSRSPDNKVHTNRMSRFRSRSPDNKVHRIPRFRSRSKSPLSKINKDYILIDLCNDRSPNLKSSKYNYPIFSKLTSCVKISNLSSYDTQERLVSITKPFKSVGCRIFKGASNGIEDDNYGYIDFSTTRDSYKFVENEESGRCGYFEWEGRELKLDYAENSNQLLEQTKSYILNKNTNKIEETARVGHASNALDYLASGVPLDQLDSSIPERVLVIQNIGLHSNFESIKYSLSKYAPGEILNIRLLRDPYNNMFAGSCFVETESKDIANMIIANAQHNNNFIDNSSVLFQLAGEVPHLRPNGALQSRMDENSLKQMREHARILSLNAMERNGRTDLLEYERLKQEKKDKVKFEKERKEQERKSSEMQKQMAMDSKAVSAQMSNVFSGYYDNINPNSQSEIDQKNHYYFDYNSGYYVYPSLGLYYHPTTNLYYYWDANKNEFVCQKNDDLPSTSCNKPGKEDDVIIIEDNKKIGPLKFAISKSTLASIHKPPSTLPVLIHTEKTTEESFKVNRPFDDLPDKNISEMSADGHLDYTKLNCLLCKRDFSNLNELEIHASTSGSHKKMLEMKAISIQMKQQQESVNAAIRRERILEIEEINSRSDFINPCLQIIDQSSSLDKPIDNSNIGSKMMKSMGWKEGTTLGKNQTGILEPVSAPICIKNAGIGVHLKTKKLIK